MKRRKASTGDDLERGDQGRRDRAEVEWAAM
jgi:hypothetical protein